MAVQGLDRLSRKLKLIPQRVMEAARESLEASAEDLVQTMKRRAPKDTGDLAASIGWTWGDAPAGTMVIGQMKGGRKQGTAIAGMTITIFAGGKAGGGDAFYARFQEFGTVNMPANPFFFPSYRLKKRAIRSSLSRAVTKAMREA